MREIHLTFDSTLVLELLSGNHVNVETDEGKMIFSMEFIDSDEFESLVETARLQRREILESKMN